MLSEKSLKTVLWCRRLAACVGETHVCKACCMCGGTDVDEDMGCMLADGTTDGVAIYLVHRLSACIRLFAHSSGVGGYHFMNFGFFWWVYAGSGT